MCIVVLTDADPTGGVLAGLANSGQGLPSGRSPATATLKVSRLWKVLAQHTLFEVIEFGQLGQEIRG